MLPETFNFFREYVRRAAGIVLDQDKEYLVRTRLQDVLRDHKLGSLEELRSRMDLATTPRSGLGKEVVESLTTNETSFFRDLKVFQVFKELILPRLLEARKTVRNLRFWSAASSTGQEAYSLAMLWREQFNPPGWNLRIVGTDLDETVLAQAKSGEYTRLEVNRGLPAKYLVRYFDEVDQNWRLKQEVRNHAEFRWANLHDPFSGLGKFDVILCRNVLIYFDAESKKKILARMLELLPPDGFLVLGGSETVFGLLDNLKPLTGGVAGIYTKQ
ncbi:MAG: protein-glutamate O-methyltransferase CheR [Planctomycetes bacterium]|nr:protein-glutamate O-methyltransferase CheR [Planctomycetota bacterium]